MNPPTEPRPSEGPVQVCVRHPDRETGLRCVRCERPACFRCLREAAVGYQCVDCVADGRRTQRRATTIAGAELTGRVVMVPGLIAINVVIFAITVAQAGSLGRNFQSELFQQWGLRSVAIADGEIWRLFTSGFLHFGPAHLALNMIALWIIGRDLELILGQLRFLTVYLVSLLGGSMVVFAFENVNALTAGASGAVFGLMGGLAVVLLRIRRGLGMVLVIIALNVFISIAIPAISLLGHLGGLVFGAVATAGMVFAPPQRRNQVQLATVITLMAVVVVGVLLRDAQFAAAF